MTTSGLIASCMQLSSRMRQAPSSWGVIERQAPYGVRSTALERSLFNSTARWRMKMPIYEESLQRCGTPMDLAIARSSKVQVLEDCLNAPIYRSTPKARLFSSSDRIRFNTIVFWPSQYRCTGSIVKTCSASSCDAWVTAGARAPARRGGQGPSGLTRSCQLVSWTNKSNYHIDSSTHVRPYKM